MRFIDGFLECLGWVGLLGTMTVGTLLLAGCWPLIGTYWHLAGWFVVAGVVVALTGVVVALTKK